MKVTTTPIEHSQVVLDLEIEPERVARAREQAYRRIVQRIDVPGFRRGKAPRPIVERYVGRDTLEQEALDLLLPDAYKQALEETGLQPIDSPSIDVVSRDPLHIKATVPVQPRVELGNYRELRIARPRVEVLEEQVDQVLGRLREQHATWVPVDRFVWSGDRVRLDMHAEVEGRVILDRKDIEYEVDPENTSPVPGFSHQLEGLRAGDRKEFSLPFPADYPARHLAGKEAHFTVVIHDVREKELPPLDDSFAPTVGDYETLEALRQAIRQELRERAERQAREEHEDAVLNAVLEQARVDLPPQIVARQVERLRQRQSASLDRQGLTIEQYLRFSGKSEEQYAAELRERAERQVKLGYVLDAIAEAEGIVVSDADVEAEVRRSAEGEPDNQRAVERVLGQAGVRDRIAAALRERRTIERLVELVSVESPPAAGPVPAPPAPEES